MMYYYILGCAIACLCLTGNECMEAMEVKMGDIIVKSLLWPVTLFSAIKHRMAMNRVNPAR